MKKAAALGTTLEDLFQQLHSSRDGLTQAEAAKRLATGGSNATPKKSASVISVLAAQFENTLAYLLLIATIIAYSIKDYSDGTVILAILLVNTLLGFFQEYKSQRIIARLSQFVTKTVRARRDGEMQLVDQSDLVPGDVIVLHEGDIAPADARIVAADNLQASESSLTGESLPISKQHDDGAQATDASLIYAGSVIEKGESTCLVYATASDTELGAIVKLSSETKKETAYEQSLRSFSAVLIRIVVIALTIVFLLKLATSKGPLHATELLLFIISMAIAVVPEVLPVIATVSLSSGALKLAKRHVVVKRLSSMEDLGNVSILCTDKTGTLTENRMTIQSIVAADEDFFQTVAYATVAVLKSRKRRTASTYDDAFISYVSPAIKERAKEFAIAKELPFDPDEKRRMVVLHDASAGEYYLVAIGAPETLLAISACDKKEQYLQAISAEGATGLHHLAFSCKKIVQYGGDYDIVQNEDGLAFLGYVSLSDPLRATAKQTLRQAAALGIQVKILTGDSREVAQYIGMQVGLAAGSDDVYAGDELEAMTPEAFKKAVLVAHVFARVSPSQKFAIIKALKEDFVVGYQGDGINDAPALKLADVAIAVNSATDIAKENADIILLNRDLQVVVNGIRYGRTIFVNINKYIVYTMVNNFGTFVALAALYIFSTNLPLLPIQILLTNVLTDIPLVTIYSDSVEDDDVARPEKHNVRQLLMISLALGIPTALFELCYFFIIRHQPLAAVQTSLYLYFTFIALIVFYALRNRQAFWKAKRPSLLLNASFASAFVIALGITYVPHFQQWFHFVPLSAGALSVTVAVTAAYFLVLDRMKVWYYRKI